MLHRLPLADRGQASLCQRGLPRPDLLSGATAPISTIEPELVVPEKIHRPMREGDLMSMV